MNLRGFKKEARWGNFGGNINICQDLVESDIEKLITEDSIHSLQFSKFQTPNERTWHVLNDFYGQYPQIGLRILWYDHVDFSFLKLIPNVRNFGVNSYLTDDFSPIASLKEITQLTIGETKSKSVNLDFIKTFNNLEILSIDGMKKGLENIKALKNLFSLNLRGIKLNNLDWIGNLENLKMLKLMFGSYKSLDGLSKLKNLKYLGISRVRQIENYDFLNSLNGLDFLHLEGMSSIETLPDFSELINLKKLQIENLAGLNDVREISKLKSLEELVFYFPENFKSIERQKLLDELFEISINLPNLRMTNILKWSEHESFGELTAKGVTPYEHSKSKYRQNIEGGWVL